MNLHQRDRAQARRTGQRVSAMMRERSISSESLAESVRIQRSTLENFCAGRPIPPELLLAIARRLDTDVAYLLALTDDPGTATA